MTPIRTIFERIRQSGLIDYATPSPPETPPLKRGRRMQDEADGAARRHPDYAETSAR
jgi:hypothetical protein